MSTANDNREKFLTHLAERLGTPRHTLGDRQIVPKHDLAQTTLADKSTDELLDIAKEKCQTIHTPVIETTQATLSKTLETIMTNYGGGNLLLPIDTRFEEFGLAYLLDKSKTTLWQAGAQYREDNIKAAAQADIAIAFAEFLLAESGSVVVESSAGQGRALHFLPKRYISIIPKSKIVPRSTHAAAHYAQKNALGEQVGSAIHFISGPSNSGDIEMQLVVGVHGPLEVTYVIVTDK